VTALARVESSITDFSGYISVHIGKFLGFSHTPCTTCHSPLGGDRHEVIGLRPSYLPKGGVARDNLGTACCDCVERIEG
jgi:hypothetical protein